LKLDFIITELFVGGAERCLTRVAIGCAESGDDVRVLSVGSLPGGDQTVLIDRLGEAGIDVESIGADRATAFPRALKSIRRWLDRRDAEICQTFLYHANVLGGLASPSRPTTRFVGGLRVAERRGLRVPIERYAIGRLDSLVCVSEGVAQFARRRLHVPGEKLTVIPNAIETVSPANPIDWTFVGFPANAEVILFVGRLHPQKGLELLQTSLDQIAPRGSNRRVVLVGDGPLRKSLTRWAAASDDRVRLTGWRGDVDRFLAACNVLVLPSRYEGMPNVVMEAMASGRPVVVSRVEGANELLSHAPEMQIFPIGDSAAMTDRLRMILGDRDLQVELGRQNRERVKRDFSVSAMIDAYRSHYRRVLNR